MRLKAFFVSVISVGFFLLPAYAAAVPVFNDVCKSNGDQSSICNDAGRDPKDKHEDNPLYGPDGIITFAVNLLSWMVGIAAILGIIAAGIKFITSASNPEEANNARELVIYAAVGLILAAAAQILVRAVLRNIFFE